MMLIEIGMHLTTCNPGNLWLDLSLVVTNSTPTCIANSQPVAYNQLGFPSSFFNAVELIFLSSGCMSSI